MEAILYTASVWIIPVVTAITLHEAAHGWMADRLGDDTARRLGRVSFNPIRHVDLVGTIILPALLILVRAPFIFGWAKPVPVAFHRLNEPKRDMIYVALAGPGINIVLAFALAIAMRILLPIEGLPYRIWILQNVHNALTINVVLACFNMLPLPPLDGGRVLTGLLPGRLAYRFASLEKYGMFILLGLLILVPLISERLGTPVNPVAEVLMPIIGTVLSWFSLIYLS